MNHLLALALLMTRILTDNAHDALAANDLALFTHFFDRWSDLHDASLLLVTVGDSTPTGIIGTDFYGDPVARENPNVKLTHSATDGSEDDEPVVAFDSEHGIRKSLLYGSVKFQLVAFRFFSFLSLHSVLSS
jgi:hypothetical protein